MTATADLAESNRFGITLAWGAEFERSRRPPIRQRYRSRSTREPSGYVALD